MTTYLSTAETAKMVRTALKESFPGIKFSVKSSTYAGGSSISVRWTDGPTDAMVSSVAGTFRGAYFDSSTDYKGSTRAMIDGKEIHFGADFINTRRETSLAFMLSAKAAAVRKYGALVAGVEVKESFGSAHLDSTDYDAFRLVSEIAYKRTTYLAPRHSKTAGKVIYLGNDGYSDIGALRAEA